MAPQHRSYRKLVILITISAYLGENLGFRLLFRSKSAF